MDKSVSTSTDLIPISSDAEGKRTVNARDLYDFLESKQDFSTWIKARIKDYNFEENQDFVVFHNFVENPKGGRPAKDYHLTIDMAKELSMVERNERGKQARQYFIECERRAKADPMKTLNDPTAMRTLLLTYTEKVLALEETVEKQKPKAEGFDRIANSDGATNVTTTAKSLQMRPMDLFALLSNKKWIYRRPGGKGWIGYQDKIQRGLLIHKVTTVSTSDGREKTIEQVLVPPKGLTHLAKLVGPETILERVAAGGVS